MQIILNPIATVKNSRQDQSDDFWGNIISEIELAENIPADAFNGIEEFSHLEIIFHFDKADKANAVYSYHPQRKKDRPNGIGLTIAELVKREGNKIWVRYLDAIDGTPVLDIKPVLKEFLPTKEIKQPQWSHELMKNYWA